MAAAALQTFALLQLVQELRLIRGCLLLGLPAQEQDAMADACDQVDITNNGQIEEISECLKKWTGFSQPSPRGSAPRPEDSTSGSKDQPPQT